MLAEMNWWIPILSVLDSEDFISSIIWFISSIFLHASSHSPVNSVQWMIKFCPLFLTEMVSMYFTWDVTHFTSNVPILVTVCRRWLRCFPDQVRVAYVAEWILRSRFIFLFTYGGQFLMDKLLNPCGLHMSGPIPLTLVLLNGYAPLILNGEK